MNGMKVLFTTKTIEVTHDFYAEASKPDTDEYAALSKALNENPSFTVRLKHCKRRSHENKSKGLTYQYMRRFILIMDEQNLKTFENVLSYYEKLGYKSTSLYNHARDWFLDNYPHHEEMLIEAAPQRAA